MTSSALGYTAQLVSLLATYLGVGLHYSIQVRGSRSAILDTISVMRGPRAFPLYYFGVERYRFEYGVFLLNKNIEQVRRRCSGGVRVLTRRGGQLMYRRGLAMNELKNSLPNLLWLLLVVMG